MTPDEATSLFRLSDCLFPPIGLVFRMDNSDDSRFGYSYRVTKTHYSSLIGSFIYYRAVEGPFQRLEEVITLRMFLKYGVVLELPQDCPPFEAWDRRDA